METLDKILRSTVTSPPGSHLKKNLLASMASSVLNNPVHHMELKTLLDAVELTIDEVINAYVHYDFDLYAYGNEVYDSLAMRAVLYIHNLLEGSWHGQGQRTMIEFINRVAPTTVIDMGFGAPGPYMLYLLRQAIAKVTLCDVFDSAFIFAKALLNQWDQHWHKRITFKQLDMNCEEFIGAYDLYIFQDSLEHVADSKKYLEKYVQLSPSNAHFIFSLPIGPLVPVHYITWFTPTSAMAWLENCGLEIVENQVIPINPEVDLFAEQLNFDYKTLMVLCRKKRVDC